ncbi:hypothetical protein Lal_00012126 [Lupinus albus]|nr:hypothetical protein Lal_00012126 [Lupinus albus]
MMRFLVPIGIGVLAIQFEGILNDRMKGFYRSTYEHNGKKKNLAVTQFEPTCLQGYFQDHTGCMSLEMIALSNMPIIEEKNDGILKQFHTKNCEEYLAPDLGRVLMKTPISQKKERNKTDKDY